jgi:hypothetical protein
MNTLLLILLILILFGGLGWGAWPRAGAYSAGWGYAPVSFVGLLFIILVLWLVLH